MEVGKPKMNGKLEIENNLTCYHLHINKLTVIVHSLAKNVMFTVTRPTLSKTLRL